MKNVIVGMIGSMILLYTVMISLSSYSVYVRKNEVEKCLSMTLENTMNKYYLPRHYEVGAAKIDSGELTEEIRDELRDRLWSDSGFETRVLVCDMDKGIISAEIIEDFKMPAGKDKRIICRKTIVADKEV